MNKAVIASVILLLIVIGIVVFTVKDGSVTPFVPDDAFLPTIEVAGTPVKVHVADSPDEHARGLSGRSIIPFNQGMLFVFDKDDTYSIWMKDMEFSLDIVWIDASGTIVDIRRNVRPETYPEVFGPRVPSRYVLELVAGFTEAYNIEIGDAVTL